MELIDQVMPTWQIIANNDDISAQIGERFICLSLTDAVGLESDMLEITLDDSDADKPLLIPPEGAELELFLGYDGINQAMGLFVFDEAELAGWPSQLIIRARAATYDKSKGGKTNLQTQKNRSWPKGTKLGHLVKTIAKEHGMEPAVADSLAAIVLPHTDQSDESDINLLVRMAKRYDAIIKPAAGKLILAKRGESRTVSGKPIPPVTITAGECSSYRLVKSKRETAGMVVAYWHAVKNSKRNEVKVGTGEPVRRLRQYYPTEEMALAAARAELSRRERAQETLALSAVGNTGYLAEAPLTASGFRPDFDGGWLVSRVVHRLDAAGGYVCDIEAERPNSGDSQDVEVG